MTEFKNGDIVCANSTGVHGYNTPEVDWNEFRLDRAEIFIVMETEPSRVFNTFNVTVSFGHAEWSRWLVILHPVHGPLCVDKTLLMIIHAESK